MKEIKENYLTPELRLILLSEEDIIRTSAGKDEFDDGWGDGNWE